MMKNLNILNTLAISILSISTAISQVHYEDIKNKKDLTVAHPTDELIEYHIQNVSHGLSDFNIQSGSRLSSDGQKLYFFIEDENLDESIVGQEIAVSERNGNNAWSSAKLLHELNNNQHNGVHFVSHDNERLLLLAEYGRDGMSTNGVSMARLQDDGTWSKPKALKIKNYHNEDICSFHMSSDENSLLLAINHRDSYGQQDIYVSFKDGKKWSKPMNLGPQINSYGSEGAMMLAPDNKTLYFSTNANRDDNHGGYDVYKTVRLDDTWKNWSEPQNLGFPYNTPHDELYFTTSAQDDYDYLSRHFVEEDGDHHSDIIAIKKEIKDLDKTLKVIAFDKESKKEVKATITLIDQISDDEIIFETEKNQTILKDNQYKILVSSNGYISHEEYIVFANDDEYTTHEVFLNPKKEGTKWEIENIFFAFDDSKLLDASMPALNNLVNLMNRESDIIVEISGHTDTRGNDMYNLRLSNKRSKSVVEYLIGAGISKDRLKYKGYGERQLNNDCENGVTCTDEQHQENRRVELKVIGFQDAESVN